MFAALYVASPACASVLQDTPVVPLIGAFVAFAAGAGIGGFMVFRWWRRFGGKVPTSSPCDDNVNRLNALTSLEDRLVIFDNTLRITGHYGRLHPHEGKYSQSFAGRRGSLMADALSSLPNEQYGLHMGVAKAALRGETRVYEWPWPKPDGGLWWNQTKVSPLRNAGGIVIGGVSLTRDITPFREAADSLRRSHIQFHDLFHQNPVAMLLQKHPGGEVVDVNDAFLHLAGYEREEVLGNPSFDLAMWSDERTRERARQAIKEAGARMKLDNAIRTSCATLVASSFSMTRARWISTVRGLQSRVRAMTLLA